MAFALASFAPATHFRETSMGFPSPYTPPFPGMPCSLTPAESPAQSSFARAYWCLPGLAPGRPLLFGFDGAPPRHLRYGLPVALSTLRHGRCLPLSPNTQRRFWIEFSATQGLCPVRVGGRRRRAVAW